MFDSMSKLARILLLCCVMATAAVFAGCGDDSPMSPDLAGETGENGNSGNNGSPEGGNEGGEQNPGGENPGEENPGGETPGEENPGGSEEPEELVLFEGTFGPIASFGTGFTNAGFFTAREDGPVTIIVESNDPASRIFVNVALPNGGFATNQTAFNQGDANPAVVEIDRPQRGQAHFIRISEGGGSQPFITYTVRVVQDVD
jgi:hypothetical protein